MDALVTTAWLNDHLDDSAVRIIDASYFVQGGVEKARALYTESHIPGAQFFDIEVFADTTKSKPHAFPTAAVFATNAGKMGIGNQHHVIVYDRLGGTSAAARAWFMFRTFGHDKVSVLDGGFDKWTAEQRPVAHVIPTFAPTAFRALVVAGRVVGKDDILVNTKSRAFQVLDARSKGRFDGTAPEPRPGLASGHIPGSRNLPSADLIDEQAKTWKDLAALEKSFADAGIDLSKPLVTTCGSGVTACALAFGAYIAGKTDTAIYDGSWVEWGADAALPVETGA